MAGNYNKIHYSKQALQPLQGSIAGWVDKNIFFSPLRTLFLITILAFAMSLTVLAVRPASLVEQRDNWWSISLNLINGKGYSVCNSDYFPFCGSPGNQVTASREPLPVLFFAVVAMFTKGSLLAAILVEILLYVMVIWGIFFLTKEWLDTRRALLAAFLWSVYLPALREIRGVAGDLAAAVGVTFGLYFILRARNTERTSHWLKAGLCLGVGVMSRSAVLVVVATILIGLILERWSGWQNLKKWAFPSILILLVVIGMMTPWVIRNEIVLGKPIIGSSLTGYNIYRHNYMLNTDHYFHYVGPEEGSKAIEALLARRTDLLGTENEAQMDVVYRNEGLSIIRAYPMEYLLLSAFRFFPLWFNWQVGEAYGSPANIIDYSIMLVQAALLFFAMMGLRRSSRDSWPLWSSVLVTSLAYMLVDSQLRYLLPVMPLVISLSVKGGFNLGKYFARENYLRQTS